MSFLAMVPRPSSMTCLEKEPRPSACLDTVLLPNACLDMVRRLSVMLSHGASV